MSAGRRSAFGNGIDLSSNVWEKVIVMNMKKKTSLFTNPKGFESHEDTNNNNIYIHGDGRNSMIDMH